MKTVKSLLFIILILSPLFFISCLNSPTGTDNFFMAPLNGKIFDADNFPCSGVLVKVDNSVNVKSDINGRFVVPSLMKGDHKFLLSKPGFEESEFTFSFINKNQVLWVKMTSLEQLIAQIEIKFDENKWYDAEGLIARAVKIEPENVIVKYLTSVLYIRYKRYQDALDILLNLADSGQQDPVIYLSIADIYEKFLENPAKAIEYLEKYTALEYDERAIERIANLKSAGQ